MKYRNPLIVLSTILVLGLQGAAYAGADTESVENAAEAELQVQLEAEYKKALSQAEQQRQAAEASIEKAREQLTQASRQSEKATAESARTRATHEAEREKMHEELNHARRQLRETSREISRVNREVARAQAEQHTSRFVFRTSERPVIGVILGEADNVGIKVLGVSPDGPSERAGIQQGDVIVAMGGRVLASVDEEGNARSSLQVVMEDIQATEPVVVSVERGDQTLDLTVIPEVREPLTWNTVTRFPSAPRAPDSPDRVVTVERIRVPQIDTEALAEHKEQIRVQVEERGALMEVARVAPIDGEYEFEFHEMSEMGDFALHDANVWFGLPMAQGLQLAEIDAGLGEYFKTDRGVLVLKAKADNDLQLESGDVILQVGGTEVNSPAEFMRALRDFDSGDEFELDIKRKRKDRTLKMVMPKNWNSFIAPTFEKAHRIEITSVFN